MSIMKIISLNLIRKAEIYIFILTKKEIIFKKVLEEKGGSFDLPFKEVSMLDLFFILFIVFSFLIYKNIKDNNLKYTNFYILILFLLYILSLASVISIYNI